MKKKFHHPEPSQNDLQGPRYWKSLDDLAETAGFRQWVEREFPQGASELDGVNRRHFMKIMAASFALGGLGVAGCRRPEQKILPYSKQPENVIPGVASFYASSRPTPFENIPIVVESHQARPTKIEGNPSFKPFGGATDVFTQASVLDLYDPSRETGNKIDGKAVNVAQRNDYLRALSKEVSGKKGKGVAILAEPSTSPTRLRLVKKFLNANPEAIWAEYTPVDATNPEKALKALTGKAARPLIAFDKADRVLSLDNDFLHTKLGSIGCTRAFSQKRKIKNAEEAKDMNRLYAVESDFTLTGGMADHRLRVASSHIPALVAMMAVKIFAKAGFSEGFIASLKDAAKGFEGNEKWLDECVADLLDNQGASVVTAGDHLAPEVHALVFAINSVLGANGRIVSYAQTVESPAVSIQSLADSISAGKVDTLIILGGNPAYNAPADLGWEALQKSVKTVIRQGMFADETARSAKNILSATHYLENWSDGRAIDGTYVPVQPSIAPLYDSISEIELLAYLSGEDTVDAYDQVFATFKSIAGSANAQNNFNIFLTEGVWESEKYKVVSPKANYETFASKADFSVFKITKVDASSLELRIKPSNNVWDGSFSNNGWMQEVPEPMTKLTWDNAICVSPKFGKELGVVPESSLMSELNQLVPPANDFERGYQAPKWGKITANGVTIEGPIHVQPGLADYTVVLTLGYGRDEACIGNVGKGTGFNVFPLVTSKSPAVVTGARLEVVSDAPKYFLANTQEHWSMEGRAIIRESNVDAYVKEPEFVDHMGMESHSPPIYGKAQDKSVQYKATTQPRGNSAYETPQFKYQNGNQDVPQQWGMVIDLNTCIGCNACVVACQSENNIPVVGKDQVLRGREMHWNRLDRYYSSGEGAEGGIPEDPQVSFMGVACMHCELAPCESVCPVNATVHDEQGLNTMAYNRCVGTRYCANNCPYKVRRFNFFDYNKRDKDRLYEGPFGPAGVPESVQMQKNPDVTVRMRGVMEKCTYCVQRIEGAKIRQKSLAQDSNDVRVKDGTIKVACQQVCPADAIEFGDISDANTAVSKAKDNDRDYSVLGYLNIRPRTTYLAKLRNPNPKMPDYYKMPLSKMEYKKRSGGHHGEHHSDGSHDHGHDDHSHDDHGHDHSSLTPRASDPLAPIPLKSLKA